MFQGKPSDKSEKKIIQLKRQKNYKEINCACCFCCLLILIIVVGSCCWHFQDLRHLQTLLMNRNSISFIELDAFSSLTKLNAINLTYNRLESFDNRIFEQNLHLTVVDLSGNKFMHLPNAPILRSASLEVIVLRSGTQHNEIICSVPLRNCFMCAHFIALRTV